MTMQKVKIRRISKIECLKAVIELENRGYECLMPIKREIRSGKAWINVNEHGRKRAIFNGNQLEEYYFTIMVRKV
jgi:hypothetical protein